MAVLILVALGALAHAWLTRMPDAAFASWSGLVATLPFIRRATRALRPPRWPWPAVPLAHLPVAMALAAAQLAIATALAKLLGAPAPSLMVEVRRDLAVYAVAVLALLIAGRDQA